MISKKIKKCFISLTITCLYLVLSSCAGPVVKKLQNMPKDSNKYNHVLAREYQNFAEYEMNEMFDEIDSRYFASKGIDALTLGKVSPENPANWKIPKETQFEIMKSYKILNDLITEENINNYPVLLAKAQVGFDCWLEQQEENWQWEHIKKCKDTFIKNSSLINKSITNKIKEKIKNEELAKIKIEKEALNKESLNDNIEYINPTRLYFRFDSSVLDTPEKENLNKLINISTKLKALVFIVEGHTDSSGHQKYNLALSKKRALNVKNYLIKNGINDANIRLNAFGEDKLLINTDDGVKEKKNRRVEITIVKK